MRRLVTTLSLATALLALAAAPLAFAARAPVPVARSDTTMAFREHGVRLTMGPLTQATTRRLTARWSVATNALGDASSYRVRWVTRTVAGDPRTTERLVTTLSDTLTITEPLRPDSTTVRVTVWARRRGLESIDSVWATRGFGRLDAPPPPPGPVLIDTGLVVVDSVAVLLPVGAHVVPNGSGGSDTTVACAYGRIAGTWYRAQSAVMIRAVATSTTTARLDAFARPWPSMTYCAAAVAARLSVRAVDSFLPVVWRADSTVATSTGGSGFEAGIDGLGFARRTGLHRVTNE